MKKVVVFLLGVMILLTGCDTKQERVESTVTVVVERVEASDNYARLPYVGTVEEESSTSVSFTGMGVLNTLAVNEGQPVRKGQLLAVIDETQARSMLATTKAALDQALDAQARMKQLHDNQSLPDIKWAEIESKVQQAKSAYDIAKKNLEDCRIYAPVSGLVGAKIMDVGETVLPTEPVLTILSIDRVKVRVSIPEREIAGITADTPTQIAVDALDGETFQGGKIEKGISADPLTHTYDIRIAMPNPEHKLLPGMVAKVTMASSQEKAIVLPIMAVQQATDNSLFVWAVKEKRAHRQPVSIGQVIGNSVAIVSGLSEGELVIVEGYQKVGEGSPVNYDIKGKTK